MNTLPIGGEISIMGGDSLNLEMRQLQNDVTSLKLTGKVKLFTTLESLGLVASSSLVDIANRLPTSSMLVMNVYGSTHGATMPLPTLSAAPNPNYISGILYVSKGEDNAKTYYEFRSEYYVCHSCRNIYNYNQPEPWSFRFVSSRVVQASLFQNKIGNMFVPETYYFDSASMAAMTDSPTSNGSWVTVMSTGGKPDSDRKYIVHENSIYNRSWSRVGTTGSWVSLPVVFPDNVDNSHIRIGDMKVDASGNLNIRVSGSLVKPL